MPRLSARLHLLGLITAAVIPVWLFAAFLLAQYALNERDRFEREALQVARQTSLVVEGELTNLTTVLEGLAKADSLASGDLATFHAGVRRLLEGTGRIVALSDRQGATLLNTQSPSLAGASQGVHYSAADLAALDKDVASASGVYADPTSGEFRVAVSRAIKRPPGTSWIMSISVPTSRIRDVMLATVPEGWTVAIGDRTGSYVARSKQHEEMTGKPGLPEYVAKVVGRAGTFKSVNFQGTTLLAGYYRSPSSGWFYTANVPMSVVRAPLWRSLSAIGAIGLLAMAVSSALTYFVGKGFTRAAGDLRDRAAALGEGRPVQPMQTNVSEFAVISEALMTAERDLSDRASELRTVLETVPAAVWFTYDPGAREVIRNRFAADLMGLPTETRKSFGSPDQVIDTVAIREGHTVSREDRPLSRAMRGEQTDNEEFAYILPSGIERILLSSARPILDAKGGIIGAVQISLDITERKRGEEQRKLLVNELNHRVKNTLAVVQSIASQTMRTATDLNEAGTSLSGRLLSLAKAHDILTQESWSGADLEGIVASSIAAQEDPARVELSGPMVRLPPNLALSLALVIHELTTNAIKYGALSNDDGRVLVGWTLDSGPTTHHIRIEWREIGGPQVTLPERKGFGTRMFERIFDRGSEGNISMVFGERGLVCTIELEVPYAAMDAPGANG